MYNCDVVGKSIVVFDNVIFCNVYFVIGYVNGVLDFIVVNDGVFFLEEGLDVIYWIEGELCFVWVFVYYYLARIYVLVYLDDIFCLLFCINQAINFDEVKIFIIVFVNDIYDFIVVDLVEAKRLLLECYDVIIYLEVYVDGCVNKFGVVVLLVKVYF